MARSDRDVDCRCRVFDCMDSQPTYALELPNIPYEAMFASYMIPFRIRWATYTLRESFDASTPEMQLICEGMQEWHAVVACLASVAQLVVVSRCHCYAM